MRGSRTTLTGWLCGAALLATLVVLYLQPPRGQFFYPACSLQQTTGLVCPGCGGLRASHALLHGELGEALRYNALLVVTLPGVVLWWLWRRRSGRSIAVTSQAVWIVTAVLAAYAILRNLPWATFDVLRPPG